MWAFVVLSRIKAIENTLLQIILSVNFHSKTEHKIKHNQICLLRILGIGPTRTACTCLGSAWESERTEESLGKIWPLSLPVFSFLSRASNNWIVNYMFSHSLTETSMCGASVYYASDFVNKLDQTMPLCGLQSSGRIGWKKYTNHIKHCCMVPNIYVLCYMLCILMITAARWILC